jgi:hypothetical protein
VTDESDDIASRVRAKCIAHLGTVESHPHSRVADMAVISDVGQIGESIDGTPGRGVKGLSPIVTGRVGVRFSPRPDTGRSPPTG